MNKKGFTLIEFLIVLLVLSILILLTYPRIIGVKNKAHDTNIQNAGGTLRKLMEAYHQENDIYPIVNSENEYKYLKNNILKEYGELPDISKYIKDDNYSVENNLIQKDYELRIESSNTQNTYIISPDGVEIFEGQ